MRKVKKHDYPWADGADFNVKGGALRHLSHFMPSKERPKPVTLYFEKPLLDLEKKIIDVCECVGSVEEVCGVAQVMRLPGRVMVWDLQMVKTMKVRVGLDSYVAWLGVESVVCCQMEGIYKEVAVWLGTAGDSKRDGRELCQWRWVLMERDGHVEEWSVEHGLLWSNVEVGIKKVWLGGLWPRWSWTAV
ncbi:hypothetical protein NE237_023589 [Protea cynaroides]|uniref:Uncharacterized protein n=1 Tax=Protea cynaroides TaxID=273540 RepID=A0A9Q0K687_9MAGN|nr:hypothetical protein NE237_023589 [Protea cynaroides]